MSATIRCGMAAVAVLLACSAARAQTQFGAIITHDQEVSNPPIPDEGSSGVGTFILNAAMTELSYDVQLFGLDLDGLQTPGNANDNVTRVHFHAAPAGSNGGIVYGIIDTNESLRNDPDDLVVNPATGRITGVWDLGEGNNTTLAAQVPSLLAGELYFNVHTSDHAGGEIRGQVLIPEPGVCVLGAGAIGGLLLRRRRG